MGDIILNKDYILRLSDLQFVPSIIDVNLMDVFDIVYAAEIKNEGISEALGMPNFMLFYDEIKNIGKVDKGLDHILLSWSKNYEIKKRKNKLEEDIENAFLNPWMDVTGIGKHWDEPGFNCPPGCKSHNTYAIEFSPLNELAHLPIKVDPRINYRKMNLTYNPSLYQIINSLFYEFTFAGLTPEQRNGKIEEIKEATEEVKDQILIDEGKKIIKDMLEEE